MTSSRNGGVVPVARQSLSHFLTKTQISPAEADKFYGALSPSDLAAFGEFVSLSRRVRRCPNFTVKKPRALWRTKR